MKHFFQLLFLLFFGTQFLHAQNFSFFKDLNAVSSTFSINNIIFFNGEYYFVSTDTKHGSELWKTDGTVANTSMLKDINPGKDGSAIDLNTSVIYNGKLYFIAKTEINGFEIWVTDGTQAGTKIFYETYPGWISRLQQFGLTNQPVPQIYIVINDTAYYKTIYTYNETARGFRKVYTSKEIVSVYSFNNKFLFYKTDTFSTWGGEPWITDGTPAGTFMLKDIDTTTTSYSGSNQTYSSPVNYFFGTINGSVLFGAKDRINGYCLWKTNGTTAGTVLIKDFASGLANGMESSSSVGYAKLPNGSILFAAADTTYNYEPWVTDGTTAGTFKLQEIAPGNTGSMINNGLKVTATYNNKVIFMASDPALGVNPYATDGTAAGTYLIKDIFPATTKGSCRVADTISNGAIILSNDSIWSAHVFITDGTAAGTQLIATYPAIGTVIADISYNGKINGKVMYKIRYYNIGGNGAPVPEEKNYVTDGTIAGTTLINFNQDINTQGSSNPSGFIKFYNEWFFGANNGINGYELWKTDGTIGGTYLFRDLIKQSGGGLAPSAMQELNGKLYFFGIIDSVTPNKLLKYAGGSSSNISIADGSSNGSFNNLRKIGSRLFYSKSTDVIDNEPWNYNGSQASLMEINTANNCNPNNISYCSSSPVILEQTPTTLVFKAKEDNGNEYEYAYSGGTSVYKLSTYSPIYTTDTTTFYNITSYYSIGIGNLLWSNSSFYYSNGNDTIFRIIAANSNNAYMVCNTGNNGNQLWKINASNGVISQVKIINPTGSAFPRNIYYYPKPPKTDFLNGSFFFFANDGVHGMELWKSDGTAAGTVMVKDINPSGNCRVSEEKFLINGKLCINIGGRIYFVANDGVHGDELWTSDGTAAGTFMTTDVNPGHASLILDKNSTSFNIPVQFLPLSATDSMSVINLFNGVNTEAYYIDKLKYSLKLFDINKNYPDLFSYNFPGSHIAPEINLMSAYSPEYGHELYKYSLTAPPNSNLICNINSGCTGDSFQLNYKIPYTTNLGNHTILQLSDSSGAFTSPLNLDTLALSMGSVTTSIPLSTLPGSHYRVRIITTNPPFTLPDNGTDISIATPPQITNCIDSIVATALPNQCGANVTYNLSATATPQGENDYSKAPGSFFPIGTTPVYFTAWNGCGYDTCYFNVIVHDNVSPALVCPADIVTTDTVVTYTATATDNCGTPLLNFNPPSGSVFPVGTTTVTVTATDSSGNSSSCQFAVTITVLRIKAGLKPTTTASVDIKPVPANNFLDVFFQLPANEKTTINITDVMGINHYSKEYDGNTGSNAIKINSEKLSEGFYFVEVKSNTICSVKKVLIKR